MTYIKYSDLGRKLKEGDKIMLGGREGRILSTKYHQNNTFHADIDWNMKGKSFDCLQLSEFPDLLVEAPRVTISMEARNKINDWITSSDRSADLNFYRLLIDDFDSMLDSMVEDDE